MSDCLFCKIVAREVPSDIVHDSQHSLAFRDVNPAAPQHVLVIPKRHVASAADLGADDAELLGDLFDTISQVAAGAGLESFRVVTNVGAEAGQSVHHLHLHVIGGRQMSWPPG